MANLLENLLVSLRNPCDALAIETNTEDHPMKFPFYSNIQAAPVSPGYYKVTGVNTETREVRSLYYTRNWTRARTIAKALAEMQRENKIQITL